MIFTGNALEILRRMPDKCVHMGVTSSPYYGLRSYDTTPIIWGGYPTCEHEWDEVYPPGHRSSDTNPGPMQHNGNKNREKIKSDFCKKCGAWRGELGHEPTPELFVEHLVEIFREFRRVLRDDGVLWANIGDSYAGSGRGPTWHNGIGNQTVRQGFDKQDTNRGSLKYNPLGGVVPSGCKAKDLIGIPWMLAFALRADGWYLRADLPWVKRNSMPSSVRDRPASSIEHIFLLSKSPKYFYDHVAVMQLSSESYNKDKRPRGELRQRVNPGGKYPNEGQFKKQDHTGNSTYTGFNGRWEDPGTGLRFMRDSDFFFRTWQGLLQNENGEPVALVVNPKGYKGAHFAAFPVRLVEPLILAGTSEKGVCPECGAPWVRTTEKGRAINNSWAPGTRTRHEDSQGEHGESSVLSTDTTYEVVTTGWVPSCDCGVPYTVPATVLDPFNGAGTTGVCCKIHGRKYIGIELNPEYVKMSNKRIEETKVE